MNISQLRQLGLNSYYYDPHDQINCIFLKMSDVPYLKSYAWDSFITPTISIQFEGDRHSEMRGFLYPLFYQFCHSNLIDNVTLTQGRSAAVWGLFYRWSEMGYNKYHAKSPYGCKSFQNYLDRIGYLEYDLLICFEISC